MTSIATTLPLELTVPGGDRHGTAATGITAIDVVAMLRRHYQPPNRPPAGVFAPEIQSPDGRRRADLIWMPATVAGGVGIHGHEIKCSRSDVLAELADPTKADPWAQYCTRWWLVVSSPSLISGLDIPEAWGVLAPPSGRRTRSMTVVRSAPELRPLNPAPAFERLTRWLLFDSSGIIDKLTLDLERATRSVEQLRDLTKDVRNRGDLPTREEESVGRILAAVKARCRDEQIWAAGLTEDLVVATLVDYAATADAAKSIRASIRAAVGAVRRAADPIRRGVEELERAERLATVPPGPGNETDSGRRVDVL